MNGHFSPLLLLGRSACANPPASIIPSALRADRPSARARSSQVLSAPHHVRCPTSSESQLHCRSGGAGQQPLTIQIAHVDNVTAIRQSLFRDMILHPHSRRAHIQHNLHRHPAKPPGDGEQVFTHPEFKPLLVPALEFDLNQLARPGFRPARSTRRLFTRGNSTLNHRSRDEPVSAASNSLPGRVRMRFKATSYSCNTSSGRQAGMSRGNLRIG